MNRTLCYLLQTVEDLVDAQIVKEAKLSATLQKATAILADVVFGHETLLVSCRKYNGQAKARTELDGAKRKAIAGQHDETTSNHIPHTMHSRHQ